MGDPNRGRVENAGHEEPLLGIRFGGVSGKLRKRGEWNSGTQRLGNVEIHGVLNDMEECSKFSPHELQSA